MDRRKTISALAGCALAGASLSVFSQQKQKIWRIGLVWGGTGGTQEEGFLAGLKDHGYEVGRNVVLEVRYAKGDPSRYAALLDEVMAAKPDILIGTNTQIALEMKRRTRTIPIVLGTPGDPVGSGLVQSLARPGGNITGMSLQIHELSAKHIQLLAEVLPRMRKVAVLSDQSNEKSITEQYERIARTTASAKGLEVSVHRFDNLGEIHAAFRDLEARRADALLINPSPRANFLRQEIIAGAAKLRLATIGFSDEWAQDGALLSFGPSFVEAHRRSAYYVDRIIKGAKPADLPLEQPTKFSLGINRATARQLGVSLSDSLLVRADRVFG